MQIDRSNTLFSLAADLVNHTSCNIFLTGKAGTGKTTFLRYIREHCLKQLAVVAPTGVAAINAGGVTIHSFFQLPFTPFMPGGEGFATPYNETLNQHSLLSRMKLTSERKKILQELELLVIDEVSMVRADVLDAIDHILRQVRHRHQQKFGGVQLVFIGDLFQLPPVVKTQEWDILSRFYKSPFFFDSKVMENDPPLCIELTKIYRQSEEQFIELLNGIRNNDVNGNAMRILQSRYQPDFSEQEGYITLTTHNERAKNINSSRLNGMPQKPFCYHAEIEGDFPESAYPCDGLLELKVGAQVMFLKNDMEKIKRFYNGKIGIVTALSADTITVECPPPVSGSKEEPLTIEVKQEKWENIRYSLNRSSRKLEEQVIGSFTQYPLKLAWAITIHKSQGLTFGKAVIDVGTAFAPGQVYVALSRCTNLEGMILKSHVKPNSLSTDPRVVAFSNNQASTEQLEDRFREAKKHYQQNIIYSVFDLSAAIDDMKQLKKYLDHHHSSFNTEGFTWAGQLLEDMTRLQATAHKFHQELKTIFPQPGIPEEITVLQERVSVGARYFEGELKKIIAMITGTPVVTDSRIYAKEFHEQLREIFAVLSKTSHIMCGLKGGFNTMVYHQLKKDFVVPAFSVNVYAGTAPVKTTRQNHELYQNLKNLRDDICRRKDLPVYLVLSSRSLEEMSDYLPQTMEELEQINGFGKSKLGSYGKAFLEIINEYCLKNDLASAIAEKPPKKLRKEKTGIKKDTKAETHRLYKEGKTIAEIAAERNLSAQTIEGHLAHYVELGSINIHDLVSSEKVMSIEAVLKDLEGTSLAAIKERVDNSISFGEIRLVLAWINYLKNSNRSAA